MRKLNDIKDEVATQKLFILKQHQEEQEKVKCLKQTEYKNWVETKRDGILLIIADKVDKEVLTSLSLGLDYAKIDINLDYENNEYIKEDFLNSIFSELWAAGYQGFSIDRMQKSMSLDDHGKVINHYYYVLSLINL